MRVGRLLYFPFHSLSGRCWFCIFLKLELDLFCTISNSCFLFSSYVRRKDLLKCVDYWLVMCLVMVGVGICECGFSVYCVFRVASQFHVTNRFRKSGSVFCLDISENLKLWFSIRPNNENDIYASCPPLVEFEVEF